MWAGIAITGCCNNTINSLFQLPITQSPSLSLLVCNQSRIMLEIESQYLQWYKTLCVYCVKMSPPCLSNCPPVRLSGASLEQILIGG